MNPSTDIPSSMEHGGRLAELQRCKCGHRWAAHRPGTTQAGLFCPICDCDGYEPAIGGTDVQLTRESVRVDGMGDNPGGVRDAAGADGDRGQVGESDLVDRIAANIEAQLAVLTTEAGIMQRTLAEVATLFARLQAENAALLERSKTWGQL